MTTTRFAQRLKRLRTGKRMTQAALASRAGISRAYEARLEMGRHDPPLSMLMRLAKALGVPVAKLVI